jgi:hypothetical protein
MCVQQPSSISVLFYFVLVFLITESAASASLDEGTIIYRTRVDAVGVGRVRRRQDGDALHHDVAAFIYIYRSE